MKPESSMERSVDPSVCACKKQGKTSPDRGSHAELLED